VYYEYKNKFFWRSAMTWTKCELSDGRTLLYAEVSQQDKLNVIKMTLGSPSHVLSAKDLNQIAWGNMPNLRKIEINGQIITSKLFKDNTTIYESIKEIEFSSDCEIANGDNFIKLLDSLPNLVKVTLPKEALVQFRPNSDSLKKILNKINEINNRGSNVESQAAIHNIPLTPIQRKESKRTNQTNTGEDNEVSDDESERAFNARTRKILKKVDDVLNNSSQSNSTKTTAHSLKKGSSAAIHFSENASDTDSEDSDDDLSQMEGRVTGPEVKKSASPLKMKPSNSSSAETDLPPFIAPPQTTTGNSIETDENISTTSSSAHSDDSEGEYENYSIIECWKGKDLSTASFEDFSNMRPSDKAGITKLVVYNSEHFFKEVALDGLSNLETLSLYNSKMVDTPSAAINLPKLQNLTIDGCSISEESINVFSKPNTSLTLSMEEVTKSDGQEFEVNEFETFKQSLQFQNRSLKFGETTAYSEVLTTEHNSALRDLVESAGNNLKPKEKDDDTMSTVSNESLHSNASVEVQALNHPAVASVLLGGDSTNSNKPDPITPPEIVCFLYGEDESMASPVAFYTDLPQDDLAKVEELHYLSNGSDNAMNQIDWSKLSHVKKLTFKNAQVLGDATFVNKAMKLANLEHIHFENCTINANAIRGFEQHAQGKLKSVTIAGNIIASQSEEVSEIDRLITNINQRSGNRNAPVSPKMSNQGLGNSRAPISSNMDNQGLSDDEAPRRSPPLLPTQHTSNRPALDKHGAFSSNYKSRLTEMQINSGLTRDFATIQKDVSAVCKKMPKSDQGRYVIDPKKDQESVGINYISKSNGKTQVLEARADSVKIFKGWRASVDPKDKKISLEKKALIVLGSLGIPPSYPDEIQIKGNPESRFVKEIHKQFNILKSAHENEVEVEVKPVHRRQ
jgi:hypothetical protein